MKKSIFLLSIICLFFSTNAAIAKCSNKDTSDRLTAYKASSDQITALCNAYDDATIKNLLDSNFTLDQVLVFQSSNIKPDQISKFQSTSSVSSEFWKNWSIGLGLLKNSPAVVSEATVVNGVVRANSVQKYQTDLVLARHWYFGSKDEKDSECTVHWIGACFGLMVTVGLGGNQVVDMIGGGFLIGFGGDMHGINRQNQPHNIGVGMSRRFNVKTLGDGIALNAPLPAGETQIRYQTMDINAPFFFYTYNFAN